MEIKNFSRAQAAVTDALYFLVIVSGLAVLMYLFSIGYGLTVVEATAREYQEDFASSALKTILYSSTPRNPELSLDEATEVDYLLAVVKEDFADDARIDETLNAVRDNISAIMEPFSDNFDYMFYIFMPDRKEFALLMLYISNWETIPAGGDIRRVTIIPKEDSIFFCSPTSLDAVDQLLASVGTVYQSSSRIQLLEIREGKTNTFPSEVKLSMWNSAALPEGILGAGKINCPAKCALKKTKIGETFKWIAC